MKVCTICKKKKVACDFYKHHAMADGRINQCKECVKGRVRANKSDYDSTMKGVVRVIYKTQKRSSRLRGHGDVKYTKSELSDWLFCNGFEVLYKKWIDSGKVKDLKPSVDRIDSFKGYSFDNIKLGTWKDNREHQALDIRGGVGTGGLRCKPLLKLSGKKRIISKYASYSSAVRDIGYSLEYQIKTGKPCRNGFYWVYI